MTEEIENIVPKSTLELYSNIMSRVKLRIDEARQLVWSAKDERAAIYAALQLRTAIEEVAIASFVGNRPVLENLNMGLSKISWRSSRKRLRELNSRYWPTGVKPVQHPDRPTEWLNKEGRIEESEVAEIWGRLSSLLHAQNPYREEVNWREIIEYEKTLISRLIDTLNEHILHLYDSDHLICGQFWANPPNFYVFKAIDPNEVNPTATLQSQQSRHD